MRQFLPLILVLALSVSGRDAGANEANLNASTLHLVVTNEGQEARVAAVEITDDEGLDRAGRILDEAAKSGAPVAVTVVEPNDVSDVHPGYFGRLDRLEQMLRQKRDVAIASVKVDAKNLKGWFSKNKSRLTLVSMVVGTTGSMKFVQLMLLPTPVSLVPAIATSMILGGIMGGLAWNFEPLTEWIKRPGGIAAPVIEHISRTAGRVAKFVSDGERAADVSMTMESKTRSTMQLLSAFVKTTEVNMALLATAQIVLYTLTQTDAALFEGVVEAFKAVSASDVTRWASLGAAATAVSLPLTLAIEKRKAHDNWQANGDADKLSEIEERVYSKHIWAMTGRAVLFSSLIIANVMHWPALSVVAGTGIGVMMTYNVAAFLRELRFQRKCSTVFGAR